ncbi:helix-turn-helix transcriptional regulator [Breoghania sp.]|uniref:helix-turn-helix transcriptional regulator n=1 Tax=Breoghania sp. TaxID=2065378 RepID=UPI0029CA5232|nr:helix-turn-helix transcriptional regulator [Breoghania sp.]
MEARLGHCFQEGGFLAVDADRLDQIVTRFYEAAIDPQLWRSTVNDFAQLIGAVSTHLMAFDKARNEETFGFLETVDPQDYERYVHDYLPDDIRVPRILGAPVGKILRDPDFWSEEEKRASPIFNEFMVPKRIFAITGAQLGMEGHTTWFGVGRTEDIPFSQQEVAAITRALPNIRQAMRIGLSFWHERNNRRALSDLWSATGRGVVIVTPTGLVTHVNAVGEALRARGVFRASGNRLAFPNNALAHEYSLALAALKSASPQTSHGVAGHAGGGMAGAMTTHDGEQIGVRFLPVLDGGGPRGSMLVVLFVPLSGEPAPEAAEIAQFGGLFGLTASEQGVVGAVAGGIDMSDYARARAIALDTARKHLKSALFKTGCRSQKALVRLIERFCFMRLR